MKFMNAWDIEEAVMKHRHHPMLSKAAKVLNDLRNLADEVSDGWAYWKAPVRAAKMLMTLIEDNPAPTKGDMTRAFAPIKAFLTREADQLKGKTIEFPAT